MMIRGFGMAVGDLMEFSRGTIHATPNQFFGQAE